MYMNMYILITITTSPAFFFRGKKQNNSGNILSISYLVPADGTVAPPDGPDPNDPAAITQNTFQMKVQPFQSTGGPIG